MSLCAFVSDDIMKQWLTNSHDSVAVQSKNHSSNKYYFSRHVFWDYENACHLYKVDILTEYLYHDYSQLV